VEISCEFGNEPSGSIKAGKLSCILTSVGLSSGYLVGCRTGLPS
jgi:hypothetical protein